LPKKCSDLTEKNLPDKLTWTDIHQKAFDEFKEEIRKNVMLYTFEVTKLLYCDSCDCAVGRVLN